MAILDPITELLSPTQRGRRVVLSITTGLALVMAGLFVPMAQQGGGSWMMPAAQAAPAGQRPANISQAKWNALAKVESGVYGHDFHLDPLSTRLDRMETFFFGSPQNQSGQTDAERLDNLMTAAEAFQEQQAPTTTVSGSSGSSRTPSPSQAQALPNESDYPSINKIEQQLFNQTYASEALPSRLNRIETKLYGKPMQGSLADRVDRLRPLFNIGKQEVARRPQGINPGPVGGYPGQGAPPTYGPPPKSQLYGYNGNSSSAPPPGVVPYGGAQGPNPLLPPNSSPPPGIGNAGTQAPATSMRPLPGSAPGGQYGQQGGQPMATYNIPMGQQDQPRYGAGAPSVQPQPSPSGSPYGAAPGSSDPYSQTMAQVEWLEVNYFKSTFAHEPLDVRLNRLEMAVFNQQSPPGLTPEERVQRLSAVAEANNDPNRPEVNSPHSKSKGVVQTILPFLIMSLLIAL